MTRTPRDHIDRMTADWAVAEPDLDVSPLAVAGRLLRLAAVLQRDIDTALRTLGLSFGDFDVLNTLRRDRGDRGVNPRVLARSALITSGAMTTRLDRLEERGLVTRAPDPDDRRGALVRLTDEGRTRAEGALDLVLAADRRLLAPLSARQEATLVPILRLLLATADADP